MNNFHRKNQLLSLCGLNCGLCPMLLGKHCGGCGNGNQSCSIARCSLEHGAPEYCYDCSLYPCDKYLNIDAYDSFITHKHQKSDLEKAKRLGIEQYNLEQKFKISILNTLLEKYNDGRRKSFFCTAVNLLELAELQEALNHIEANHALNDASVKERSAYAAGIIREIADRSGIELRLNRKK